MKPLEVLGLTIALVVLAISLFVYFETPSTGYLVVPTVLALGIAAYIWLRKSQVKTP